MTSIIRLPFYLKNSGNYYECPTPEMLKNDLEKKEIGIKTALMTNSFIPVFVPKQYLNIDGIHIGNTITASMFPPGSVVTNQSNLKTLSYFIGLQGVVSGVVNGMYPQWTDDMNNSRLQPEAGIETILQEYFYCYDVSKLCFLFQNAINLLTPSNTCIFNYNKADNTFSISFNSATAPDYHLIVNDDFINIFPFPYAKMDNGLNRLLFMNPITFSNAGTNYLVSSCYVTSNFCPFNTVFLSCDLPIQPLQINSNFGRDIDVREPIVFQFDKLNNNLNFYDYFFVDNELIQSWQSFEQNTYRNNSMRFSISFRTVDGKIMRLNKIPDGQRLDIVLFVKSKL